MPSQFLFNYSFTNEADHLPGTHTSGLVYTATPAWQVTTANTTVMPHKTVNLSCFQTCTGTLNASIHYTGELHVRMHVSERPEVTQTLSCNPPVQSLGNVCVWSPLCHVMPFTRFTQTPLPLAETKESFFPRENTSDSDNLLLWATCVKAPLHNVWTWLYQHCPEFICKNSSGPQLPRFNQFLTFHFGLWVKHSSFHCNQANFHNNWWTMQSTLKDRCECVKKSLISKSIKGSMNRSRDDSMFFISSWRFWQSVQIYCISAVFTAEPSDISGCGLEAAWLNCAAGGKGYVKIKTLHDVSFYVEI